MLAGVSWFSLSRQFTLRSLFVAVAIPCAFLGGCLCGRIVERIEAREKVKVGVRSGQADLVVDGLIRHIDRQFSGTVHVELKAGQLDEDRPELNRLELIVAARIIPINDSVKAEILRYCEHRKFVPNRIKIEEKRLAQY